MSESQDEFNFHVGLFFTLAAIIAVALVVLCSAPAFAATNLTVTTTAPLGTLPWYHIGYHNSLVFGSNGTRIDKSNDGSEDTFSNTAEVIAAQQESKAKLWTGDFNPEDNWFNETTPRNTSTSNYANFTVRMDQLKNALSYGWMIDYRIAFMFDSLATNNATCVSQNTTCGPSDFTKWLTWTSNAITTSLCNLYPSQCLVSFWNEPSLTQYWLRDVSTSNTTREALFNDFYNRTYTSVKGNFSTLMFCGGSVDTFDDSTARRQIQSFIQNFSSPRKYDCLVPHEYQWELFDPDYDVQMNDSIQLLYTYCSNGGASSTCDGVPIIWSEVNVRNSTWLTITNSAGQQEAYKQYWLMEWAFMRNNPSQQAFAMYKWQDVSNDSVSSDPDFQQFQEAQVYPGQMKKAGFNFTRDLGTILETKNTTYDTSSTNATVRIISYGNNTSLTYSVVVINKNATIAASLVNVSFGLTNITSVVDYFNGTTETVLQNNSWMIQNIPANTVRIFNVTATNYTASGGGSPANLTGIPVIRSGLPVIRNGQVVIR